MDDFKCSRCEKPIDSIFGGRAACSIKECPFVVCEGCYSERVHVCPEHDDELDYVGGAPRLYQTTLHGVIVDVTTE